MYFEYKLKSNRRRSLKSGDLIAVGFFILFFVFGFVSRTNAVTVGPAKLELSVNPGEIVKGEFFLQNDEKVARKFVPVFEGFTEDGVEKVFFSDLSDLATWFKTRDDIVLGPGEFKNVPYTLTIPKDAAPGGHFAVIWWSTVPIGTIVGSGMQLSVITQAGILAYLRVSGDIKETGELVNFTTGKKIYGSLPIAFNATFKNTGNVYLAPKGTITVKTLFSRKTVALLDVNQFGSEKKAGLQILPGKEKGFGATLDQGINFGIFKAVLDLTYGEKNTQVSDSIWFIVLPWNIALPVILVLVFVIFSPKLLKKYNKWVIEQARKI